MCRRSQNGLERGSLAERKAFIRSFVKEVIIERDEAKLTYTLQMLPRGLREETEPVLAIVHNGGAEVSIFRTIKDSRHPKNFITVFC